MLIYAEGKYSCASTNSPLLNLLLKSVRLISLALHINVQEFYNYYFLQKNWFIVLFKKIIIWFSVLNLVNLSVYSLITSFLSYDSFVKHFQKHARSKYWRISILRSCLPNFKLFCLRALSYVWNYLRLTKVSLYFETLVTYFSPLHAR